MSSERFALDMPSTSCITPIKYRSIDSTNASIQTPSPPSHPCISSSHQIPQPLPRSLNKSSTRRHVRSPVTKMHIIPAPTYRLSIPTLIWIAYDTIVYWTCRLILVSFIMCVMAVFGRRTARRVSRRLLRAVTIWLILSQWVIVTIWMALVSLAGRRQHHRASFKLQS